MNKKLRKLAVSAGARTEYDFALFANLASLRDQVRKLRVPKGAPPVGGIILRYDHYLTRGRFYQPQPLPKGYRRGRPKHALSISRSRTCRKRHSNYCSGSRP